MLPQDFIATRHAESEGNIAQEHSRLGDDHSFYTERFRGLHGSNYRLTPRGVSQAQAAGAWLAREGFGSFDEAYVSEYIRAIETAGHLELEDTSWITTDILRERDSGLMDCLPEDERQARFPDHIRQAKASPYFWTPPEGESFARVSTRLRAGFLPILSNGQPRRRVTAVSHGHTIRILRALIERLPFWEYESRERGKHPDHLIENAQITHYTRVDPQDATHITDDFEWVRTICPWDLARTNPAWRRILRPRLGNGELLAIAERFPRLL